MGIEAQTANTLVAAVADNFATVYPIAYPDRDFTPPAVPETYLEIAFLPNGSARSGLSSQDAHQGILQVSVMNPAGSGVVSPMTIAGTVADVFDHKRIVGAGHSVTVPNRPTIGQPFPDGNYSRTPVTINYVSESTA